MISDYDADKANRWEDMPVLNLRLPLRLHLPLCVCTFFCSFAALVIFYSDEHLRGRVTYGNKWLAAQGFQCIFVAAMNALIHFDLDSDNR